MVLQPLCGSPLGATRPQTLGADAQSMGSAADRISGKTATGYCGSELSKPVGGSPPRENTWPRVGSVVSKSVSEFGRVDDCVFLDGIHVERSAADLFWRPRKRCRRPTQSSQ